MASVLGPLLDAGRSVDEEFQVVGEGGEGEILGEELQDNHDRASPLTTVDPRELSGVDDQCTVEGISALLGAEEKMEGRETDCLPGSIHGVKPYRNIEGVFLPLPANTEDEFADYMRRGHGRRSEASASRQQPINSQDNYLGAISDAEEFKKDLIDGIEQMMYVSGETGEPSAETTGMIEEIVRQQVVEIVSTPLRNIKLSRYANADTAPQLHRARRSSGFTIHHYQ